MTASSQTSGPTPGPVPLQHSPALQAAPAAVNPDVSAHLVVPVREPSLPECFNCGITGPGTLYPDPHGRRYTSGARVLYCGTCVPDATPEEAVTAVVAAEMAKDAPVTPRDIAAAEVRAGVTFDPRRFDAAVEAAREQAVAEYRAELAQAAQDRQAREWFHDRWLAAGRLCEDRALDDTLRVGAILTALDGRTPTGLPFTIRWDGTVTAPAGDGPGATTLVPCTTARGGPAVLVLDDEQRLALGGQLLATDRLTWACPTTGCGMTADELDGSGPPLFGWIRVQVAGVDGPPRWWCSPGCVHAAMTAAAAELAAADRAAATAPHQQAPDLLYGGDVGQFIADDYDNEYDRDADARAADIADDPPCEDDELDFHRVDDDEPHCVRCGCSARRPCPGGCHWVPNAGMVDLCSRCASPEDITPEASPTGGAR